MESRNSKYKAIYEGSVTQKYNDEALIRVVEMEKMMKGNDVPNGLKEELTICYFINRLMLLTTQN